MPKIVIGMPFDGYRDAQAESGSGIKKMLVSPMDYWNYARNPNRKADTDTPAKLLGKGYHARVVESLEAFKAQFTAPPAFTDMIDGKPVLETKNDIQAFLTERGIAFKKSADKADSWALVPVEDGERVAVSWDEVKAAYHAGLSGKETLLTRDAYDEIIRNVEILSAAPTFADIFEDGLAEVSIFWKDKETALECKARFDRVRPNRLHEVKTVSNSMEKDFEKLVVMEIGNRRYNIAACHYLLGWYEIMAARKAGKLEIEILDGTPPEKVNAILDAFDANFTFEFLFIQTGEVPFYMLREFCRYDHSRRRNGYWHYAETGRDYALAEIKRLAAEFGEKPWLENQTRKPFDDADFPPWMVL